MIDVIRTKYTAFERKPTFNIILAHLIGRFMRAFRSVIFICGFVYSFLKTFTLYKDSKIYTDERNQIVQRNVHARLPWEIMKL